MHKGIAHYHVNIGLVLEDNVIEDLEYIGSGITWPDGRTWSVSLSVPGPIGPVPWAIMCLPSAPSSLWPTPLDSRGQSASTEVHIQLIGFAVILVFSLVLAPLGEGRTFETTRALGLIISSSKAKCAQNVLAMSAFLITPEHSSA